MNKLNINIFMMILVHADDRIKTLRFHGALQLSAYVPVPGMQTATRVIFRDRYFGASAARRATINLPSFVGCAPFQRRNESPSGIRKSYRSDLARSINAGVLQRFVSLLCAP